MKIIILCGGSGSRLWPVSRERFPKQFVKINNNKHSLFQETFFRALLLSESKNIYIITNKKYKFLVSGELEEIGYSIKDVNLILEPNSKNTLPAIFAGVHQMSKKGEDNVLVMPSDHMILNNDIFSETIKNSIELSSKYIVTFGVKPTHPNTGYGYISVNSFVLKRKIPAFQ